LCVFWSALAVQAGTITGLKPLAAPLIP
jgi:hypothetical protein